MLRLRGLSLLETVVGLFLLLTGVFLSMELTLSGFRQQSASLQLQKGVAVAERSLQQVKLWAANPANFRTDWAIYRDYRLALSELRGAELQIKVPALKQWSYSPCRGTEANRAGGGRRLGRSTVTVELWVRWGARDPAHSVHLVTQVNEPTRPVRSTNPLTLTFPSGFSGTLAKDDAVVCTAQLWDDSDQVIEGVPAGWSTFSESGGGMGHLEPSADFSEATMQLHHRFYAVDSFTPPIEYVPGGIRLYARVRYAGVVYEAYSPDVVLSP